MCLQDITRATIVLAFLLLLVTAPALRAEEPLSAETDPLAEQGDIYYNAMLRSIDLDRSRWKPFSRSPEGGPWFYDSVGLKRNGSRVATSVTVFPHPLKTALYAQVFNDHRKIKKIVFDTEFDCKARSYRQPRIVAYGYYDELLVTHNYPDRNFTPIKQGTTTDTLQGLVCTKSRPNKQPASTKTVPRN